MIEDKARSHCALLAQVVNYFEGQARASLDNNVAARMKNIAQGVLAASNFIAILMSEREKNDRPTPQHQAAD